MLTAGDFFEAFPFFTNQAFSWLALCVTFDARLVDWPSIIVVVLPLGILTLDADIADWQDEGLDRTPPRVPEPVCEELLLHLVITFWMGCFESMRPVLAQPSASKALLVAVDLCMTTTVKWIHVIITFLPIYWTLRWSLSTAWRWQD